MPKQYLFGIDDKFGYEESNVQGGGWIVQLPLEELHPGRKNTRCHTLKQNIAYIQQRSTSKSKQNCSWPWGHADTDLLYFRSDVVPLHVAQQCRHIGHTLMLIQLIHLQLHSLILRHNLLTLLKMQTVVHEIFFLYNPRDNILKCMTSALQETLKSPETYSSPAGAALAWRILGVVGEALNSSGEVKLTHLLTETAVCHVGLGGEVYRCTWTRTRVLREHL